MFFESRICVSVFFKIFWEIWTLLKGTQGLCLPVGCKPSLPLWQNASEPGTRWRSWTSPCSSLCSRGNVASFRRRWYEMAETASVTEAQGFSNIGTRYLLHHVCELLAWAEAGECLEGKGIRTSFFPQKNKRPGCVSNRQRAATAGRLCWN